MQLHELQLSQYYFRWAKSDQRNNVLEISVEKRFLTPSFQIFLAKNGYRAKPGREKYETEHFEHFELKGG